MNIKNKCKLQSNAMGKFLEYALDAPRLCHITHVTLCIPFTYQWKKSYDVIFCISDNICWEFLQTFLTNPDGPRLVFFLSATYPGKHVAAAENIKYNYEQ